MKNAFLNYYRFLLIYHVILLICIVNWVLYGIYQNLLINNIAEILFDKVFIYSYLIIR